MSTEDADSIAGQISDTDLAGPVIADFIAKQVESAHAAASSLQSRGLAVISSSGTLVVLLFGLSTLATKAQNFALPNSTKLLLFLAAIFLVIAAFAGITTNAPRTSEAVALRNLRPLLEQEHWNLPAFHAQQEIAQTMLSVALSERRRNIKIARFLLAAITCEIIGIFFVTFAIVVFIAAG
jgi:hypothetical protein